jgi:hypothetical protein
MRVAWSWVLPLLCSCAHGDAVAPATTGTPSTPLSDTVVARDLAPGVAYRKFMDGSGPNVLNLVRVDLRRTDLELRQARALDQLVGREKTSDMARRVSATGVTVLVAVNGDFFATSGENENNQVIGGEWWKGLQVSESTFDTFDTAHAQFGTDASGRPLLDRFVLDGKAWARGTLTVVATINSVPPGAPTAATLYTWRRGATTPRDTLRIVTEAPMLSAGKRGDTLLYVRRGATSNTSGSAIPSNGAVLVAYGTGSIASNVQAMADGDTVKILLSTLPRPGSGAVPSLLIGGWPQILSDGVNVTSQSAALEGTIAGNTDILAPRTAVGFSRDSSTLYLLTVDGRSALSVGMTIAQLAAMLQRLGAWHAMNFDGGGSTTMVINGQVVNAPSDPTGERVVGNALLVVRKP